MYHTILVPLDGSALAERALTYAVPLAKPIGARLVLMQAQLLDGNGRPVDHDRDVGRELSALAATVATQGVAAEPYVYPVYNSDEVAGAICDSARAREADLIAMSTHGRGGLGRWLYGSVADAVLRLAEVPVLLAAATAEHPWAEDKPLRILVPLDGSKFAEQALARADELAAARGDELLLLQVIPPTNYAMSPEVAAIAAPDPEAELNAAREYLRGVQERLSGEGKRVQVHSELGTPAATIVRLARERDVDLIAMATHGRGGLARVVLGSVATGILHRASVPLLIVRPEGLQDATSVAPPVAGGRG